MDIYHIGNPDNYDIYLLLLGLAVLEAAVFPRLLTRYLLNPPIAYLLVAIGVFMFWPGPSLAHPATAPLWGKRLTEISVIIALTAAGLKIKEPFAWKTWMYALRLLVITMPLTIALVALFGWGMLGYAPAAAVLLGAVIAPTDPVLASDIQTSSPMDDHTSSARLALTSEAGLNDGLAFPFTNMAIAMALLGAHPQHWFVDWLVVDFFYKIIAGAAVGWLFGWILEKIFFALPKPNKHDEEISVGILVVSLTLVPYAIAELVSGYGFIAVFVAACTYKQLEKTDEHLNVLLTFSQELERMIIPLVFTLIGLYIAHDFISDFQWYMIPAALVIILVIRPLSGYAGLAGINMPSYRRNIIAFYGIRGIGSVYYLFYAFYHASFEQANEVLALVMLTIILSVMIHGFSSRPVLRRYLPDKDL
jgi:sodium/hydrogen antiporter